MLLGHFNLIRDLYVYCTIYMRCMLHNYNYFCYGTVMATAKGNRVVRAGLLHDR
jgi:hypothetical protein